jgi:hypothetical protein
MPIARPSLKLARLRHHFGIRAPRLTVRPHWAWYVHVAGGALAALLAVALFALLARAFQSPEARDLSLLRARLALLERQVDGGTLSALEIADSTNRQLSEELRILSAEHAALQDDLAYFLRLVPVGTREGEVRLERLSLRAEPGSTPTRRYRYSLMVGYQSGRQPQDFVASLQFVLTVQRSDGKEIQRLWPEGAAAAGPEFQVRTRHWQRKEGVVELLPGERLKKIEARLVQGKAVRATSSVTMPN